MVEVHVGRDGHLTLGKALEEVGLAAAVLPNEAIAAADGELDAAVLDKLSSSDRKGESTDLDVARSRPRCQDASDSPEAIGGIL
jgi:hypothetical protein